MLLIYIIIIFFFAIAVWVIENENCKKELKKTICLEGYYERFNFNDKELRKHQTIDNFINSARILYPWEKLKFIFLRYQVIVEPKPIIMLFDARFEGGFPHTHGKFILASSLKQLSKSTYKHEQIHIYQRFNPIEVNKDISSKWKIKGLFNENDNQRANPDTNTIHYDSFNARYASHPKSLIDIENKNDHPFEVMAYKFQN